MAGVALERLLQKLDGVKKLSNGWMARCPAHDDTHQSLSIGEREADGAVLLNCHAGCGKAALLQALGITFADLYAPTSGHEKQVLATYDYRDASGLLLYQAVRFWPKEFRQRRPDGNGGWIWDMAPFKGKHVPYRLSELQGQPVVVVVEGERDVDRLWKLGIPATTNIGGAKKWTSADTKALVAAGVQRVIVLPDNDLPGLQHAKLVCQSVKAAGLAQSVVELPDLPEKGDVSDWLAAGHTKDDLQALLTYHPYDATPQGAVPVEEPPQDAPQSDGALDVTDYHRTDLGAAESFRDRYQDRLRFDHQRGRWLDWSGHYWRPDLDGEAFRLANAHIRQLQHEALAVTDYVERKEYLDWALAREKRAPTVAMMAQAETLKPLALVGDQWDSHGWVLGCPNGVVDLKTGQLRDGQREDFVTLQAGALFDPTASYHRWVQFLYEIFDNDAELVDYVWRALGYSLTADMREQCFFVMLGTGANGKDLALDTQVPTPHGWTTQGQLRVGDEVFDERGQVCHVLGLSTIWTDKPCFRVVFSDGTSVVTSDDHQWSVRGLRGPRGKKAPGWRKQPVTTREMSESLVSRTRQQTIGTRTFWVREHRWAIPTTQPLQLPPVDLPLDPYTLGYWLANGTTASTTLACHEDDAAHVESRVAAAGYPVSHYKTPNASRVGMLGVLSPFVAHLRTAGVLGRKHIPPAYLRASFDQRLALLQGLMDGDGSTLSTQAQCEYCTTLAELSAGVMELLRTFGLKPTEFRGEATLYGRVTGPKFRIIFTVPEGLPVFSSPRKRAMGLARKSGLVRHVVACEPVDPVPVRCIAVDSPNHLYLVGEGMVPTHNSIFLDTVETAFGTYGHRADMRMFAGYADDTNSFQMADFRGKRMVFASEVRPNSRMNEHVLKHFTGGESLRAEYKYGQSFTIRPVGKIWLGVNHRPKVADDSYGFWRRMRLIPFLRTFSGSAEDRTLRETLRAEASGILRWMVQGCLEWQARGLTPPSVVQAATEEYQAGEDLLAEFFAAKVRADETTVDCVVSLGKLYVAYREWASGQGMPEREKLTSKAFSLLMESRPFPRVKVQNSVHYKGLELISEHLPY